MMSGKSSDRIIINVQMNAYIWDVAVAEPRTAYRPDVKIMVPAEVADVTV